MKEKTPRVVVIGVGNLIQKDEGVGIHAIRSLQEMDLPADVKLVDGGTSPDLIAYTKAGDKMIIIDCATAGGEAGEIYRFKPEELEASRGTLTSAHEMGVVENLKLMEMTGNKPKETVIIGIEPAEIDWGMELSPRLEAKLPELVGAVLKEIGGKNPF
ncbi:MAG: HyaD/HybD family hydrogenase maturation endopeptidase [Dehalococcoidales bacterium]|nr:HyaD/HybD family hydrogenase maturation endopeptidase [Dehalococcoidales bacterium]